MLKQKIKAVSFKSQAWWEAVKGEMQQGCSALSQDLSLISSFLKLHSHMQPTICFYLDIMKNTRLRKSNKQALQKSHSDYQSK